MGLRLGQDARRRVARCFGFSRALISLSFLPSRASFVYQQSRVYGDHMFFIIGAMCYDGRNE